MNDNFENKSTQDIKTTNIKLYYAKRFIGIITLILFSLVIFSANSNRFYPMFRAYGNCEECNAEASLINFVSSVYCLILLTILLGIIPIITRMKNKYSNPKYNHPTKEKICRNFDTISLIIRIAVIAYTTCHLIFIFILSLL